jgi:signal recognition particle subunit SRP54
MLGINSSQQNQLASQSESVLKQYETAYNSMTATERQQPKIIDSSRRRRIATGSGLQDNQLGKMLNEFEQMRAMFSQLSKMLGGFNLAGLMGGGAGGAAASGMENLMGGGMPPGLPPGMDPQQMARAMQKAKRETQNLPGFMFGSGGGYYRKKKR